MTVTLFEVGGCVRDSLLGIESKDIDFAVEATSFEEMRDFLISEGFEVFLETPEYYTIRARFPRNHEAFGHKTADFVLCRTEDGYSDGRRPDSVRPGTIYDDLKRRDFTVNAIARDSSGNLIDPHGGVLDLKENLLRCVGSTEDRFTEDALRAIRAIRFTITKGFELDDDILLALYSEWLPPLVAKVSAERRREELTRCFQFNNSETLLFLASLTADMTDAIFADGLWLCPSLKQSNNKSEG